LLETFVNKNQTVAIPKQDLATVENSIEEDKIIAIKNVSLKVAFDNATQAIKALTHVGWQRMDKYPRRTR